MWKGSGIDPTYVGSSDFINNQLKWRPTSIKILEVVDRTKSYKYTLMCEAVWIDKFVILYGIPEFVPNTVFTIKHKRDNGQCLNLNNNSAINAIEAARRPEVVKKRVSSQLSK